MRRTLERKTQSRCTINELLLCGSGGTGRRARLRILWPKGRGGSNPSFRTSLSDEEGLSRADREPRDSLERSPDAPLSIYMAKVRLFRAPGPSLSNHSLAHSQCIRRLLCTHKTASPDALPR